MHVVVTGGSGRAGTFTVRELAEAANPSPSGYPRQQTFANNVLSTYHVMQAAGDNGVTRLSGYSAARGD
ncbi:MAG: hypothetical protein IT329_22475 [Caldilineaceae bacterium]|nr:hypothetical protein [Caldilineaceae bacterium]